ncbi:unnamed protein product [Moneuplotes crassus]|uniref:Uncharacterized protein n=1 Tax=Euplotes crassus TaxID=5936 RepID=A0AAD2CVU3_EUPCR|nr:unnamed protein product [Moneuplotes crassus]
MPVRMFSFNHLTQNYLSRRAMNNLIIEINKKEAYAKLPIYTKFIQAFTKKKRRFGYLIILWLLWFYDVPKRSRNWAITKRYKVKKKYYNRWMHKFNPERVVQMTALETLHKPKKISTENFEKLGKVFIEVENQLLYGVSRQLIINTLVKLDKMDTKLATKFLRDSGYKRARARTLHSCTLIELCELFEAILDKAENEEVQGAKTEEGKTEEGKIPNDASEDSKTEYVMVENTKIEDTRTPQEKQDDLVESFCKQLPQEIEVFEDNIESVIAEMERTGQEDKSTGGILF